MGEPDEKTPNGDEAGEPDLERGRASGVRPIDIERARIDQLEAGQRQLFTTLLLVLLALVGILWLVKPKGGNPT